MDFILYFYGILISFLAIVVVLTLHEFAHAFVAYKCGDPTPKWNRRLTLNPLRHFDPTGLVCFALVGFGWAKPVPINPDNFKKYNKGLFLTSGAGIAVNYLFAFLIYPIFCVIDHYFPSDILLISEFLNQFTWLLFAYSLSFCVFNLLPFYPLDGFRLIEAYNKRGGKVYRFLRTYGYYILLGLIIESFICNVFVRFDIGFMRNFDILGWVMQFAIGIFGWPIRALWGLIPW